LGTIPVSRRRCAWTAPQGLAGGGAPPLRLGIRGGGGLSGRTVNEARRFLREWIARMDAIYAAVSLPPEFRYPEGGPPTGC